MESRISRGRVSARGVLSIYCLATIALAAAVVGAPADPRPAPEEDAASVAPAAPSMGALLGARCTEPGGPALDAGPWITNVTPTTATVVFQTGGDVETAVRFLVGDGACDEAGVYGSGERVPAELLEQAQVPYSQPGDLITVDGAAAEMEARGFDAEGAPFADRAVLRE